MTVSEKAKSRMLKLLALARRGERGEREKAQNLLNRMLREQGLTMADLDRNDLPRSRREFPWQTSFESHLLTQIAAQVLDTPRPPEWKLQGGRVAIFELTDLEHLEMELRWRAYRPALRQALERCFEAFIQAQDIYPNTDEREARDPTPEEAADALAVLWMAEGIPQVTLHRPLPAGKP